MTLRRAVAIPVVVAVLALTASAQQQPPPAGERGRGRGGDPFAGQPRINALIVSGGCCHDYPMQAKAMMDAIGRALPVDWTVVVQGGRGTTGTMPIYATFDKEYPLAWTSEYHGARVFGTTIGHGNATFEDPVFLDLLTRGFKWALKTGVTLPALAQERVRANAPAAGPAAGRAGAPGATAGQVRLQ